MKKIISFCIPILNEEENIRPLYEELIKILEKYKNVYSYEIIFTDNKSTDNSYKIIQEINSIDKNVKCYSFSNNMGKERSLINAYKFSSGDAAIQLDCDFQDPPELIDNFIKKWEEGYEYVYAIRKNRKENFLIKNLRKIFYRLINFLSHAELKNDVGDFSLVDKKIIEILKSIDERDTYLRGFIYSLGFKSFGIEHTRNDRIAGNTKFNFFKYVSESFKHITNHTIAPLRIATLFGLIISFFSFIGFVYYFIQKIFDPTSSPQGFTTLVFLMLLILALNSIFIGIIGEYVGKIYNQLKKFDKTVIIKKID
ncbi:glycosyltransferase family 2 protein [Candidatus Pelagibacter sp.]|uniref:glycosyltransferase family 2 protein n=1 Tax=Candidatus Pelagibacter sp. TaxID=2024849 RepID=UPI003F86ACD6